MTQICGEFADFNVDRKTNIKNTMQKFGKFNVKKISIISGLIILSGSIITFFVFLSEYKLLVLLGSIFSVFFTILWIKNILKIFGQ